MRNIIDLVVAMKTTNEIEQQDYLNAVKPFRNGCSFRAIFESDGRVLLEPGCYCLVNLINGAEKLFFNKWLGNKKNHLKSIRLQKLSRKF